MATRDADWNSTFDVMRDMMFGNRMYMDLYERETLAFIFGRTQLYGKEWEVITLKQFMEGVRRVETGEYIASPVAMSKTKLLESLRHLKAKRIIEVRLRGQNSAYRIVPEIDVEHAITYMRRNQRKEYESIFGRFHRRDMVEAPVAQARTGGMLRRITPPVIR